MTIDFTKLGKMNKLAKDLKEKGIATSKDDAVDMAAKLVNNIQPDIYAKVHDKEKMEKAAKYSFVRKEQPAKPTNDQMFANAEKPAESVAKYGFVRKEQPSKPTNTQVFPNTEKGESE